MQGPDTLLPVALETTLAQYLPRWLPVARTRYRRHTVEAYTSALRHHVLPALGHRPLRGLSRLEVRGWLVDCLGRGMPPLAVRAALVALSTVLTSAGDDGLVSENAAHGAARRLGLRYQPDRRVALTAEQARRFFAAAEAIATRFADLFVLLSRTGCRLGEALGAQASDVDLGARLLHVQRSYHGQGDVGPTKSGKTRFVDLSHQAADVCRRRLERARPGHGWLFATEWGDWPYNPGTVQKIVTQVAHAAGLPRGFGCHVFRHTFASRLIAAGVSPAYVQRQLGHADISTTVAIYGSHLPMRDLGAVDALDD
jgi:integrase